MARTTCFPVRPHLETPSPPSSTLSHFHSVYSASFHHSRASNVSRWIDGWRESLIPADLMPAVCIMLTVVLSRRWPLTSLTDSRGTPKAAGHLSCPGRKGLPRPCVCRDPPFGSLPADGRLFWATSQSIRKDNLPKPGFQDLAIGYKYSNTSLLQRV